MKFLSLLLSFIMAFTALPMSSLVDRKPNTQTKTESVIENDDVTLEGGGGIGGLLTESIQQSQQNEAAKDEEENVSIENKILDVVVTDNIATVSFNNDKICKIIVAVFDEEGKEMLAHGMVENIEEYAETVDVTIDNGTIPQYYLIRAFLLDENNVALHKSFETNYYTKAHQEFLAKTTDDFEGEEILNLDEDETNNFAVYNDGVIHITENGENTLLSADDETRTYVFENINSEVENLKIGDIVNYNSGDTSLIFKVKTITFDGTKATVTGDDELALKDVFNFIKIDTKYAGDEATCDVENVDEGVTFEGFVENVATYDRWDEEYRLTFWYSLDVALKTPDVPLPSVPVLPSSPSSMKLKGEVFFSVGVYMAIALYDDYLEVEFSYDQTMSTEVTFEGSFEYQKISLGFVDIPLPIPGLAFVVKLDFVAEASVALTFSKEQSKNIGFLYRFGYGLEDISETVINDPAQVELSGKVFIGVKFNIGITALKILTCGLSATVGIEIIESASKTDNTESQIHNCTKCVNISTDLIFELKLEIKFDLIFIESGVSFNIAEVRKPLGTWYLSSELGWGCGYCPNYLYRIDIEIVTYRDGENKDIAPLSGVSVGEYVTDENGYVTFFAPRGKLILDATKDGYEPIKIRLNIEGYVCSKNYMFLPGEDPLDKILDELDTYSPILDMNKFTPANGKCGENVFWELYDNGTLVISGTGNMTNYSYSSSVPWYSNRSNVKKVVIENGVTSIGGYAFYGCYSLTSVTIPDSVTSIGNYAFKDCDSLTSVTIPDSVTSIGDYVFDFCCSLTSVTIPDSVTSIGDYVFDYCCSLTSVTIPDSVKSIGNDAFYMCINLRSVTIGNGLTSIGNYAFSCCYSLASVTIPDSVTSIGERAFDDCSNLTSITVDENNNYYSNDEYGVLFNKDKTTLIQYPIGNERTSYVIPDSVTSIGNDAFCWCTNLRSVTIGNGLTSIGNYAFFDCSSLASVTIGNGLTSIGNYAFSDCSSLASVTIGNSVTSIGDCAFKGCDSLTSVTIGNSVTSIGNDAFDSCDSLTSVTVDENNEYYSSDEYGVLFNKDKTTLIQYPTGNARTSYVIPDSVTSIGKYAFYKCSSLASVTIGNSVTSIGYGAFRYCDSLTDVYYGGSEEQWNKISIGSYNDPLLNATIHYNSAEPTVYESINVKSLAAREYEVPKTLAESALIAEPAANTVTKDDLVPGAVYTLIIMKGTQYDYELTNDSLLYITDAIADESGVATFTHYCNFATTSWVAVVYGECNHHASDWITVAEPTFTEKGLKAQYCTKCSETMANEEIDIIPEKMVIESLPEKLTYSYGDTLDLTGLTVKYTYTDGRENVFLSESDYTVYGFNAQTFGVQTILIESGIYKARFDITVDLTAIPDGFTDKINAGATVESLAELYPNATVYALTADGKKTAGSDEILKTGMILQIIQSDGTVNGVTVIVKGDATGDGIVNGKDIIRVKKQITQGNAVEHIEYADINSDGVVNEDDITVLMSFLIFEADSLN